MLSLNIKNEKFLIFELFTTTIDGRRNDCKKQQ